MISPAFHLEAGRLNSCLSIKQQSCKANISRSGSTWLWLSCWLIPLCSRWLNSYPTIIPKITTLIKAILEMVSSNTLNSRYWKRLPISFLHVDYNVSTFHVSYSFPMASKCYQHILHTEHPLESVVVMIPLITPPHHFLIKGGSGAACIDSPEDITMHVSRLNRI